MGLWGSLPYQVKRVAIPFWKQRTINSVILTEDLVSRVLHETFAILPEEQRIGFKAFKKWRESSARYVSS